ncbi:MAG TPA: hypothetical protein VK674_01870 [Candidatus Limnocylindria bacterium]|nr:hypothetical protein [Candidatus Limnocylindria bacterium]
MLREQLFTNIPSNPSKPTGEYEPSPLQDYVLGEMPAALRPISEERAALTASLATEHGEEAPALSPEQEAELYTDLNMSQTRVLESAAGRIDSNTDPETAKLTQLDLLFMLGSRLPAGTEMYGLTPSTLTELLKLQEERFGLRTFMDYEMIIDVNSEEFIRTGEGDMRVYTDGDTGLQERDFYLGHYLGEPNIKSIAYDLRGLVENPEMADADEMLERAHATFEEFNLDLRRYAKLGKEAFADFRPYLAKYPDGTRNASGAFMPSVQLAELALHAPTEQHDIHVGESMLYFPTWSRPVLEQWRDDSMKGDNVMDMIRDGRLAVGDDGRQILPGLIAIVEQFRRFKHSHRTITGSKIDGIYPPGAPKTSAGLHARGEMPILAPGEVGTAGFNPDHLLGNGVVRQVDIGAELRERAEATTEA